MTEIFDLVENENGFTIWADEQDIFISFGNCSMSIGISDLPVLIRGLLESQEKLKKREDGV